MALLLEKIKDVEISISSKLSPVKYVAAIFRKYNHDVIEASKISLPEGVPKKARDNFNLAVRYKQLKKGSSNWFPEWKKAPHYHYLAINNISKFPYTYPHKIVEHNRIHYIFRYLYKYYTVKKMKNVMDEEYFLENAVPLFDSEALEEFKKKRNKKKGLRQKIKEKLIE